MTSTTPSTSALPSFRDPEVLADIFSAFDVLREIGPAVRSEELGMVVVTSYDAVMEVLQDPVRFSNKRSLKTPGGKRQSEVGDILAQGFPYVDTLMNTDGVRHAFHAGLVKSYLSARRVRTLAEPITAMTDARLDDIPVGTPVEFVELISLPLTIDVLCLFAGVPESERALVQEGTDAEVALLGSLRSTDQNVENARRMVRLQHLLGDLIDARREAPQEDLISHLVHAVPPEGCEALTKPELVSILRGVVAGGNETTRGLINSMVLKLATDAELAERIRNDETAFDHFIDEGLRVTSPVNLLFRVAAQDTDIAGTPVSEGEVIAVAYGAANHDEARFGCPHAWDIDRPNVRRHLAFGYGTHYCAGSPLGRLESRIVIRRLLDRYDRIELVDGTSPAWLPSFMVRNMTSLPVRFIA